MFANPNPLTPADEPMVQLTGVERGPRPPEAGVALCLSGGGYRAMLFHVGALLRLKEAGLFGKLLHISSVQVSR